MCESLRKNIKTTPFQSCQSLGQKTTWVITKLIFALPQTLSTCSHRNYAEFPRIQRLKLNFNVSFKVGSDMSKYSFIKRLSAYGAREHRLVSACKPEKRKTLSICQLKMEINGTGETHNVIV